MENKILLGILSVLVIVTMIFSFISITDEGLTEDQVQNLIDDAFSKQNLSIPTAEEIASKIVIPEVKIPEIESADNELLNDYLKGQYSVEYSEIEDAAEDVALEKLEKNDYKIVVKYLEGLISDAIDEDSIDVSVDDTEIEVTKLGLDEDEDKCAIVTFDLEVEYELEEGVRDTYEKDFKVVFNVCFEEGSFEDEIIDYEFQ